MQAEKRMRLGVTGKVADNVYCGTVDWKGKRLSGCGALTETLEAIEPVEGYKGLFTTTHLCKGCRKLRSIK